MLMVQLSLWYSDVFFLNDTATTEIYTLSLHDALPISISVILLFLKFFEQRNEANTNTDTNTNTKSNTNTHTNTNTRTNTKTNPNTNTNTHTYEMSLTPAW